jgi:hypothetical protein
MEKTVNFTDYYEDFLIYAKKAKILQNDCNLGGQSYIGKVNDDLMENITIYDTIERRYAGFSNMLQDVWLGTSTPKNYKLDQEKQEKNKHYNNLKNVWSRREWLYIFLFHRITGSGASFESDHGYRNTIVPELSKLSSIKEFVDFIKTYEKPMFTSIGNQIPAFPKPSLGYATGGKLWLCEYCPRLVDSIWFFVDDIVKNQNRKITIRELVDFMCDWNKQNGMRQFHFQFTATAADMADYYPELVEESSHMYYGKNAKEAMDLFAYPATKMKKDEFYDIVMERAVKDLSGYPKDLEDVMCDYIRYVENYIPDNKEKTYAYIDRTKIWNSSIIKNHPKGRQKWMINL